VNWRTDSGRWFAKLVLAARCGSLAGRYGENWFRDLDSNQDTQLQRLMSYRLDDPGMAGRNCSRGMQACTGGGDGREGKLTESLQGCGVKNSKNSGVGGSNAGTCDPHQQREVIATNEWKSDVEETLCPELLSRRGRSSATGSEVGARESDWHRNSKRRGRPRDGAAPNQYERGKSG
jgi:hypothetical protein